MFYNKFANRGESSATFSGVRTNDKLDMEANMQNQIIYSKPYPTFSIKKNAKSNSISQARGSP